MDKKMIKDDIVRFDDGYCRMMCPSCKAEESNLHHSIVEIFNREEDEKNGFHVAIQDKKVTIDTDIQQNPSPRRSGLSIVFWCEQCCETNILDILQHKGMSYMRWYNGKRFNER